VHWKSIEELRSPQRFAGEFRGGLPPTLSGSPAKVEATRRDFLAFMGFSIAAAGLAGCRAPVQNAIPLLVGSDEIIPGVANWYATTCRGCASSCSLLVKQRDGRPIKIEGNAQSSLFGGGTCATGQATVLSLYDDARLRSPIWRGQPATWEEIDRHVLESLGVPEAQKRKVVLLSTTISSPSTLGIIAEWSRRFSNFRHVTYDAISMAALRTANFECFGRAVVPHFAFEKARVIVGLEADFLGTWLSPVEFARQYVSARKPHEKAALHIHFESGLSVTGSNADVRIAVAPSEQGAIAVALLRRIARRTGIHDALEMPELILDLFTDEPDAGPNSRQFDAIAEELWKHRGHGLVVSGSNDVAVQTVVNALNFFLGNIGTTVDLTQPSLQRTGDDAAMAELVDEMKRGEVHALFFHGVNPAYDYANSQEFLNGLERVPLAVSFSDRQDETGSHVHAVCPDHHFLEAWGDAEPVQSHYSLAQPLIAPLFNTRAAQESLLRWVGAPQRDYYAYLREYWRKNLFPRQETTENFETFWERSLQDGVTRLASEDTAHPSAFHGDWRTAVRSVAAEARKSQSGDGTAYELHFYESVALRDGRHANNPWLQELPDPISKVTWGNCVAISPAAAQTLSLSEGDIVSVKTGLGQIEAPVFIQPGQHSETVSIAMGYGRTRAGKAGNNIGVNTYQLTPSVHGFRQYSTGAKLTKTGRQETIATTQSHFSMEGRPIVLETTFEELHKTGETGPEIEAIPTLWAERLHGEHSWGMAIDINACTGCSACVVACQAENNIPVVGKDQVQRQRIMHWIRIDRYYSGPVEAPVSVHQPMMCQHCQNAPCETVCPVLATTTSSEGLNQQVYNRCIGTRYCANNCPYKVRRFNWYNYTDNQAFDFNMANPVGRMVLNPDVAVRSRGVMEKCSMCVQRIQLAKNIALQGKRELVDGDIQTACQQACPTEAIIFGDLKDPNSRVSQLARSRRHYQVLEDLGVRPNVGYLKKVRNSLQA
jgi:molybdopterin-containing oxidoreductase family iron-sulfur binding subunit